MESLKTWNSVAGKYQQKFMNASVYKHSFDALLNHIHKKEATILDVGCGPGVISKYLLAKNPDFKILGVDYAEKMIDLAKVNIPNANFKVLDCRNIDELQLRFDVIIFGFCFPYISKEDIAELIKKSHAILNENGLIFISTMIDSYEKSGYKTSSSGDKLFTYYHQENELLNALINNHFTILEQYTKEYYINSVVDAIDLFLIAKK